jgi:hypothetical protein
MSVAEEKMECVNEFIALANAMKDKGISLQSGVVWSHDGQCALRHLHGRRQ